MSIRPRIPTSSVLAWLFRLDEPLCASDPGALAVLVDARLSSLRRRSTFASSLSTSSPRSNYASLQLWRLAGIAPARPAACRALSPLSTRMACSLDFLIRVRLRWTRSSLRVSLRAAAGSARLLEDLAGLTRRPDKQHPLLANPLLVDPLRFSHSAHTACDRFSSSSATPTDAGRLRTLPVDPVTPPDMADALDVPSTIATQSVATSILTPYLTGLTTQVLLIGVYLALFGRFIREDFGLHTTKVRVVGWVVLFLIVCCLGMAYEELVDTGSEFAFVNSLLPSPPPFPPPFSAFRLFSALHTHDILPANHQPLGTNWTD